MCKWLANITKKSRFQSLPNKVRGKTRCSENYRKILHIVGAGNDGLWCTKMGKCEHDRTALLRFVRHNFAKISDKNFFRAGNPQLLTICGLAVHMAWNELSTIPVDNLVH